MISSMGLIVPGFSGSMLLMVFGFYDKILILVSQIPANPGLSLLRLATFAVGVAIGFILFSKLMKLAFEKAPDISNCVVLGFLVGSIIAIFVNSNAFGYFGFYDGISHLTLADYILSPIFALIGLAISFAIYFYTRKHPELEEQDA